MAATGTYFFNSHRNPRGFMTILSHVACEWFLMFLMFVDAALSYTLTKFAQYCELQTPCLLCLRLDHFFGNERPGCYLSLFCSNHQTEISSLVTCHIHGKLADVRDLCEECFMSTAMQTKSSSESYRFLVGKMGMDGFQSLYLNKNFVRGSLSTRPCSCCNKQWRVKSNAQRLIQLTPAGLGASKATVKPPLPRVSGRSRFSRRDSLKRMRDKFSGPMTPRRSVNTGVDTLSHVGYTELKRTSDSESEFPFSDDDGSVGSSVVHQKSDSRESLDKILSEDLARGKRSRQASDNSSSFLEQDLQFDEDKPDGLKSLNSDAFSGRDLGRLNWEQLEAIPKPSTPPELISLEEFPQSSLPNAPSSHMSKSNIFVLSDLMSPSTVPPQSNPSEVPLGVSANIMPTVLETTGADLQHEVAPPVANNADITKPSNQDVTNEGIEEKLATSDPPKLDKDLKLLPSTLSNQDIDSSYRSPRAYHQHNEGDASSSDGIHKVASLERIDCGYESLDGSSVCDIEGESIVERLKRQVEYDRRCMSSMQKELEEERNAAAIAANQAMAMITRLQEEKATLHMEALQYLRMMEEQAEYDMEALEKANDLVAEKEKELQDLEEELEFYRSNFPDESGIRELPGENFNLVGKHRRNEKSLDANIPFIILEDEKQYISESLKKLERKLQRVADIAASSDLSNGRITNVVEVYEELHSDRETELEEEKNLQRRKDLSSSNGGSSHDQSIASVEDNHVDFEQNKSTVNRGEFDLGTLENEISDLNERLEALENDRDFLEHACHTLQNGSEGLKFIQEIARQLQEFRKFDYERRCFSDP